jgi:DNA-formamidopyrimidine glycosylase
MAEGPVVHHYVRQLKKTLQSKTVEVEFNLKKLKEFEPSLRNLRVAEVEAHGKQFRIHFSDERVLLIHLMMWGSWRIYPAGKPWDRPRQRARVIFHTKTHDAVVFSAPVVKLLTPSELNENPRWGNLGPDPLRRDFSSKEFFRRLDEQGSREIGEVLLDQQVIAGVGNILRIEILFRAHIHPSRRVASLTQKEKMEILHWTLRLFGDWMKEMGRGRKNSWIHIYRRSGKPCPNCGTPVQFFRQAGRITYACPSCQH